MIDFTNQLIKQFQINVNDIVRNSDNTYEDVWQEAYIIVYESYNEIKERNNIFINKLKNKCLKFNKYGKRIDDKVRWERFNAYEERIISELKNKLDIDEDRVCQLLDVMNVTTKDEYDFLIFYYTYGGRESSREYGLTEGATRKRVYDLIHRIRKELL